MNLLVPSSLPRSSSARASRQLPASPAREPALVRRAARQLDSPRSGAPRTRCWIYRAGHRARHRVCRIGAPCTLGPGATNLITAIADAKLRLDSAHSDYRPGSPQHDRHRGFPEVDTFGLSLPIMKHNFLVCFAAELLEVIPQAFRLAVSGVVGTRCWWMFSRTYRPSQSMSLRFPSRVAPIRRRCARPTILAAPQQ